MSKADPASQKKERNKSIRWVVTIFIITIVISAIISLLSEEIMAASSMAVAFVILLVIVMIGIVFDIIGVAVTSAEEKPFNAMAARKVPGARQAITLLHNAERVSSICNDVIGDICGVVSGSASATIAAQILSDFEFRIPQLITLVMSALAAGLTVGGKAVGKGFAVDSCVAIVHWVGRMIYTIKRMPVMLRKQKK